MSLITSSHLPHFHRVEVFQKNKLKANKINIYSSLETLFSYFNITLMIITLPTSAVITVLFITIPLPSNLAINFAARSFIF